MKTKVMFVCAVIVLSSAAATGKDQAKPSPPPKPSEPKPVTLAVLDYEVKTPGNDELGSQMADILTVRLSIEGSLRLVERAKLGKIMAEQKLKLVGVVEKDQAVEVGKLVGAQLLVMGKGFMMDKKLIIVTKVVGVETGLVVGGIRQVEVSKPISDAIMLLSEDIVTLVKKQYPKLLPKGQKLLDPLEEIRKKLGKTPRPKVAVVVHEEHKAHRTAQVVVLDPAVETEIKRMLLACDFHVIDTGRNDLADWAKEMVKAGNEPWPAALNNADLVVVGEAFSEFALRTGDLVTCIGRAEINLIDRHTGRIMKAARQTERAVDLAENIAGKTALQKAGRTLALEVCQALTEYTPPKDRPDKEPKK